MDAYFARIEEDDDYYDEVLECRAGYSAPAYSYGALPLVQYGDAIQFYLIVSGPEAGHMWVDERAGEPGGLFPLTSPPAPVGRIGFLAWYETWLDHYLAQVDAGQEYTTAPPFDYNYEYEESPQESSQEC
jgi:hypothetical protein